MLKYRADLRTVIYMIITTALLVLQWQSDSFSWFLFIPCLYFAIAVAVIAHNHNHVAIWRSRVLNTLTDYWLTLFYGFPAFAWIPTHNKNHHKLNNKDGDYTITYRLSEKNNLLTLLTYPTMSSYFQQTPIFAYLRELRRTNRLDFSLYLSQYLILAVYIGALLLLDWEKTILYVIIPHQFALFTIMVFNYVQHVHADEESEYNHSRNFLGLTNQMLFNNGYHTIHHQRAALHWSILPEEHRKIEHLIDPSLNERSFWGYIVRNYFIGIFSAKARTTSMRLARKKLQGNAA